MLNKTHKNTIEKDKNQNVTKRPQNRRSLKYIHRKEYCAGFKNTCLEQMQVTKQCIQQDFHF